MEQSKESKLFRQRVSDKVLALLSVVKEVQDLDEFIVNVVNSIK